MSALCTAVKTCLMDIHFCERIFFLFELHSFRMQIRNVFTVSTMIVRTHWKSSPLYLCYIYQYHLQSSKKTHQVSAYFRCNLFCFIHFRSERESHDDVTVFVCVRGWLLIANYDYEIFSLFFACSLHNTRLFFDFHTKHTFHERKTINKQTATTATFTFTHHLLLHFFRAVRKHLIQALLVTLTNMASLIIASNCLWHTEIFFPLAVCDSVWLYTTILVNLVWIVWMA